jgi:hypothetical protein
MNWYKVVNIICRKLAKKYDLPLETIVGILVNLSAQKDWKTNIRQCIQFLKGQKLTGMYSQTQLVNCKRILSGENALDIWGKTSFKYRNFYASILNPDDLNPVCVDTHIIRWYLTKYTSSKLHRVKRETIFANKRNYELIQNTIRKEAKERNLVPSHYQAIIWIEQRNGISF